LREYTGYGAHLRRRLADHEQLVIGPAVDLRGTEEAQRRFRDVQSVLPNTAIRLAYLELNEGRPV